MGWSKPPQKPRFARHLRHRGKARHDRGYVERRGHKDALYIPIAKSPNYINQRTRIDPLFMQSLTPDHGS